ncbi:MAG: GEVED domain-containing protein [Bacteroidales bacterium]
MSGTYIINSALPTGGTNFQSFTDFADAINGGGPSGAVVVNVVAGSGPYNEQVFFGEFPNSSVANTVTINGNGETLEFLSTNTNERATLKFNGTDYVIVNDLVIKALGELTSPAEYGWAVWLANGADNNTFSGCQFRASETTTSSNFNPFVTTNSATGVTTAGLAASNLKVLDCEAVGGYYGMVINGPTSAPFSEGNVISGNVISDFYYYGLYVRGQNNSQFTGNEVHRTNRTNNTTTYMIYFTSNLSNSEITKNVIYNFTGTGTTTTSSGYGIYFTSVTNPAGEGFLLANNVVYGWEGRNGLQYGIYTTSFTGEAKFYHNTISLDHVGHTGSSTIYCLYQSGASAGLDIKNNIFSYTTNSTGTKYNMYFATSTSVVTSDYNVLHRGATAGTNNTGYWGAAFNTLANWQTANGGIYDQNSSDADPVFTSPLLTPVNSAINNMGTNLLTIVPDDIFGEPRTETPDPGAIEFTPVNADIALASGKLVKSGLCLSANDSIYLTLQHVVGDMVDFAATPVTIYWNVTGPLNSSGSILVDEGIMDVGTTFTAGSDGVDLSEGGVYMLSLAYIQPGIVNELPANDTIFDAFELTVQPYMFDAQPDYTLITTPVDVVELKVMSNVMPLQGNFFFTEICHYKTTTGAPVGGWPSYLLADDYIEITGVPSGDLSGFTLEMWSSSALTTSNVLAAGTVLSPSGICIIATGQLGSSVPSPANYYYHSGYTGTMGSTTAQGYVLKDLVGNIVDAVVYGNMTFPPASGVTPADWSGTTPAVSSSGNRLEGPYTKDATNWINSGVSPQDPNVVNSNVTVPSPVGLTGFTWSLENVVTSYNNPDTIVGPWSVNGIYNYIATYTGDCGTFIDTAVVEVNIPTNDLAILEILSPEEKVCYTGPEEVSISITNLGTELVNTPFNASYTIDGGAPVTEVVNLPILPAETVIYTFTATLGISFTDDTTFFLNTYVNLVGDPIQENDTLGMDVTFYFTPPAPTGVDDYILFGETATLEAISGYDVNWYASPTDENKLFTGQFYETQPLYATTSFYAAAAVGGGSGFVGPPNPSIGASASFTALVQFLLFDVLNPNGINIKTVDIYPTVGAGAAYTMVIQDASQQVIWSFPGITTVAANTKETVEINASIPYGSGYRFGFSVNPGMTRNSTGAVYPYTLPGEVSITGNTFAVEYYYFYYNWEVGAGSGCESERTEVTAFVDMPSCIPIVAVDINNITETTADLSWSPGGSETEWEIEFGPGTLVPTGIATHFISGTPALALTGLNPSTNYEFYIRSDCGTEFSDWWGPYTFNTLNHTGELLYQIDIQAITGSGALLGAEYFGGFLWVTDATDQVPGNVKYIHKIDYVNGVLVNSYPQGTTTQWGMRDLANDGNYLYAGDDNGFYRIDPATGTVTTMFSPSTVGVIRGLAYDPATNRFWTKDFGNALREFDAAGTVYNTYNLTPNPSTYGAAWDPTGPWLWLHATAVYGTGEITEFVQVNPATGTLTGVAVGVADHPCSVVPIVGGGFMDFGNMYPGRNVFGAMLQGSPDVVNIIEYNNTGFPGQSDNFDPLCGETDVPLSGTLTWDFGDNTNTYDLKLGPAGSMAQVVTGAAAGASGSYNYSGLLGLTEYEWQVVEHNATGTTHGLIYRFTTGPVYITGTLTYMNASSTPIDSSFVLLYDDASELIGAYPTNLAGEFSIPVASGDYSLYGFSYKPRGGTNITDVIRTRQFISGTWSFNTLQALAADVNGGGVSIADVIIMRQHISGIATPGWTAPDWLFESPSFTVTGDMVVNFKALCSGDPDGSYAVPVGSFAPVVWEYCESYATNTTDEWISNVTFAGINNNSGSTGYSDFTNISGVVTQGGTYPFSATIGQTGTFSEYVTVWVDWNYDGVFDVSEGTQIGFCAFDGCVVTNNITVPVDAVPGPTRMRVTMKFAGYSTNPCEVLTFGEVEDYTIIVNTP